MLPTVGSSTRAPSPGWIASGEAMNSSLDLVRIGQHHERRLERQLHRDPLAVALAQPLERPGGTLPGREHLERAREARARGQAVGLLSLAISLLASFASTVHAHVSNLAGVRNITRHPGCPARSHRERGPWRMGAGSWRAA